MGISILAPAVHITLALVLYSIGIWGEKINRYLKKWHLAFFWSGFFFDSLGTYQMHLIATKPFNILEPHTLTGQTALWLMLVHSVWATYVAHRGSEKARAGFNRYSVVVWTIWLIPYFGGMYLGMNK